MLSQNHRLTFLSWNSTNRLVSVIENVRLFDAQQTSKKVLFRWSAKIAERP